ncbi:MAG TPA: hypothetical protein VJ482_01505 [Acidimicrobiia bacterium]|nr:hypothetical protein [Acidimicrobiia bacterium]
MARPADDPVVVATCSTHSEASAGFGVLEGRGITAELRSVADRTEILVAAPDAPAARRALLDERLQREGRTPQEMSLIMKLALMVALLAVVAFAVLTVTLG